jgi:hypothetical protein
LYRLLFTFINLCHTSPNDTIRLTYKTACPVSKCINPPVLFYYSLDQDNIKIYLSDNNDISVLYKKAIESEYSYSKQNTWQISLKNLDSSSLYNIIIRNICAKDSSAPLNLILKTKGNQNGISTGIINSSTLLNMETYPNPCSNHLVLKLENPKMQTIIADIYNNLGVFVSSTNFGLLPTGFIEKSIDGLNNLTSGINYLILKDEHNIFLLTKTFLKQ